jgi:pimeloyl-ACP methyl ester carboxylesterase
MKILKNFPIKGKYKKSISTDLYFNQTNKQKPLVIFCHGYKGYKDWGAFDLMSSNFLKAGLALLKFNFSHNGCTPDQPIDFPDLDAFGNNNYTKELDDLESIINWICTTTKFKNEIDTNNISLIGHSRGGAIAIIKAAEDSRIKKLVTWAAVCDLNRTIFHEGAELDKWKEDGVLYILNGRTKQKMPHYIQFYDNFIKNKKHLSVKNAVKKMMIPHLIFHGDKDLSVPFVHAQNLHNWNLSSKLIVVPESNHVFGTSQPWTKTKLPIDFRFVVEKTIAFITNP